jgi:hypothetical protein
MRRLLWGTLLGGLVIGTAVAWGADYTLVDLGPIRPAHLDEVGRVAGTMTTAFTQEAVLASSATGMTPLGFLPITVTPGVCEACQHMSTALGVSQGIVVGQSTAGVNGFITHGFRWTTGGGIEDLNTPGDGNTVTVATGINRVGTICGVGSLADGRSGALVWIAGVPLLLPSLPGQLPGQSYATAINDAGDIVGEASFPGNITHAVRWPVGGGVEDIDTLGSSFSFATTISLLGGIGGEVSLPGIGRRGFFWTRDTGMVALEPIAGMQSSTVKGYNADSILVGSSITVPPDCCQVVTVATFWQWDGPVPLEVLVTDLPTGWTLEDARGVNAAGQITGFGVVGGERHGFRLDPITPSTVVVADPHPGRSRRHLRLARH